MQNGFVDGLNGRFRDEYLNEQLPAAYRLPAASEDRVLHIYRILASAAPNPKSSQPGPERTTSRTESGYEGNFLMNEGNLGATSQGHPTRP